MKPVSLRVSEEEFCRTVVELACYRGWMVHHCRPAQDQRGRWATHIQGIPGFPDLVLVRLSRVLFCELKSEQGKVSPAQQTWLDALELTGKAEVYTWRPDDWEQVEEVLR